MIEPTPITESVDRQIAEARAEISALRAGIAAQEEWIDELLAHGEHLLGAARPALSGAIVRAAARKLAVFTLSELAAEVGEPVIKIRPFFKPLELAGVVVSAGKLGRAPLWQWGSAPGG